MAPCCFCFLLVPWLFLEAGKIAADPNVVISPLILLANAMVAFGERLLLCFESLSLVTGLLLVLRWAPARSYCWPTPWWPLASACLLRRLRPFPGSSARCCWSRAA